MIVCAVAKLNCSVVSKVFSIQYIVTPVEDNRQSAFHKVDIFDDVTI